MPGPLSSQPGPFGQQRPAALSASVQGVTHRWREEHEAAWRRGWARKVGGEVSLASQFRVTSSSCGLPSAEKPGNGLLSPGASSRPHARFDAAGQAEEPDLNTGDLWGFPSTARDCQDLMLQSGSLLLSLVRVRVSFVLH